MGRYMDILELKKGNKVWHRNKARTYPESWATESEVFDLLYGFTRMIKPERVLEIGTFEGDTSVSIGKALRDNNLGHLITTDIKDYGQENVIKEAGLSDFITCVKNSSTVFMDGLVPGFDMIFIDDGHSFPEVIRDLEIANRLVKNHGFILGHDVLMIPDVSNAYGNFLSRYKDKYHHIIIDS